jgi:hypothetical protein
MKASVLILGVAQMIVDHGDFEVMADDGSSIIQIDDVEEDIGRIILNLNMTSPNREFYS